MLTDHELERDRIEKQMEIDDPISVYDAAEKLAWEKVPECQPVK